MDEPLVYEHHASPDHHKSHGCIATLAELLFDKLGESEHVQAELVVIGVTAYETINQVNARLSTFQSWANEPKWETEVEYIISHDHVDVHACDGAVYKVVQNGPSLHATCADSKGWAIVRRLEEEPLRLHYKDSLTQIGCAGTSFKWIKVMKIKRFCYESATSSFVFKLVAQWEGVDEKKAKQNGVMHKIFLETADSGKMAAEPRRSVCSFLAKVLDIISDGKIQPLIVRDCANLVVPPAPPASARHVP
ncbi:unnamed protein product [Ectocarpus sp. 6 AP-2014]